MHRIISLFVPCKENNHQAYLLHVSGLLLMFLFLLGMSLPTYFASPYAKQLPVLGTTTNLTNEEIIRLTNKARLAEGVEAVSEDSRLSAAAQSKLEDMFAFNYWDHFSPSKRAPWKFILDQEYSYQYAGENLGKDFSQADSLVQAWLESPDHRANLLDPRYEHIGIAVGHGEIDGKATVIIVQFFASPLPIVGEGISVEELSVEEFESAGGVVAEPTFTKPPVAVTTQAIALISISLLIIVLSIDAIILHSKKKVPRMAGKYWGHLMFLYTLGSILVLAS